MRRFCAKCAWVFLLCVDASYEPLSLSLRRACIQFQRETQRHAPVVCNRQEAQLFGPSLVRGIQFGLATAPRLIPSLIFRPQLDQMRRTISIPPLTEV